MSVPYIAFSAGFFWVYEEIMNFGMNFSTYIVYEPYHEFYYKFKLSDGTWQQQWGQVTYLEDMNKVNFSLDIYLNSQIPINTEKSLFFVPEIAYSVGLNDLYPDSDWKVDQMKLGMGIIYYI
jgi:hypothetical protein